MADRPSVVPYLSYRDPAAAIAFLEAAFGLDVVVRVDGEDGGVVHAELAHGNGVVMFGTGEAAPSSGGIYLVVDDVEAHFATARDAGAEVVHPPMDTGFGTLRWRGRDPEGNEWSFGTYRPQTEPPEWG